MNIQRFSRYQQKKGNHARKKQRKTILLMTLVCVSIYSLLIGMQVYPATEKSKQAMVSNELIEVQIEAEYIAFYPRKKIEGGAKETGYVIYPDTLIEEQAYAVLASEMAKELNASVFIVKYPFHKNFLRVNGIQKVQNKHQVIETWIAVAHGSGGAFGMIYGKQDVDAMIFLSSYPLFAMKQQVPMMAIRGTMDGVNDDNIWEKKMKLFPKNTIFYELGTGNFSYFASFGLRKEDNVGLLAPPEQIKLTIENIKDFTSGL